MQVSWRSRSRGTPLLELAKLCCSVHDRHTHARPYTLAPELGRLLLVIQNSHAVSLVLHFPDWLRIQGSGLQANRSAKCRLVRAGAGGPQNLQTIGRTILSRTQTPRGSVLALYLDNPFRIPTPRPVGGHNARSSRGLRL